jgi:flagellar biosynthesis/type III secretory pathway ATPase
VITRGRQVMATYADMEELIRLGAYRAGSSAEVDEAIRLHEPLEAFLPVIIRGRQVMATYADMEELIRLGAYRAGSSPEVDEAIRLHEPLEAFLRQAKEDTTGLGEGYRQLEQILASLETER